MSDPTIALALGGGGARGLAHVHVMKALDDMGIKPVAISGTSIGSIMGAGYASGMSGDDIREYVIDTFTDTSEVLSRFWRMRPSGVKEMLAGPRTMLGNINSKKAVSAFLPEQVPETFEELTIPLEVVATDFYGQKPLVIGGGNLVDAIAASSALPAIFRPVNRDGIALVDGGIQNALPYELLLTKADIVIAVDVVGGPKQAKGEVPTRIEALQGASQLMMQATTRLKIEMHPPEVLIVPPVNGIGVLDFLKANSILETTLETYDMTKRMVGEAIEKHS
ncbi:MAG: patatin-like phospholipase family protein [Rhizobiaceae bacterium]